MDRLIRLVPAEVIGIYLTIAGLAKSGSEKAGYALADDPFLHWWPVVALLLVISSRIWGTRDTGTANTGVQWIAVMISAISFVIWVYAIGDTFLGMELPDRRLAPAAVAVWTFVVPWFYAGD